MHKRVFDIILSLIGIIVVMPLFALIALLIKLNSKGPVLYRANRIGENMQCFKMYKFRTMIDTATGVGESLSPKDDPRVTPFGQFLRRTKMNELPQLINIVKGEMSFVGPRPEAPDLAELYPNEAKRIFSVKPGLIGPNDLEIFSHDISGRNEDELYPPGVDVKKYYLEEILPKKVEVDLDYINNPCLFKDLKYIFLGAKETLIGAMTKRHLQNNQERIYLVLGDIVIALFCFILGSILFIQGSVKDISWFSGSLVLLCVIAVRTLWNAYFGLYHSLTRFFSNYDFFQILKGVTAGSICLLVLAFLLGFNVYTLAMAAFDSICLIMLLSARRLGLRWYLRKKHRNSKAKEKKRVLIYGACDTGSSAYKALASQNDCPFEVVGFLDDTPSALGRTLYGVRVMGTRHHLKVLAKLHKVDEVLLASPQLKAADVYEIGAICREANLKYSLYSSSEEWESRKYYKFPTRSPELSDILSLSRIVMDYAEVKKILKNKTVLVNGSGGRLGLELCHQVLQLGCGKLIILDRYESYLADLVRTLRNHYSDDLIIPIVFDTGNKDILKNTFEKYRPDLVFHTCTKKYISGFGLESDNVGHVNYQQTFNLAKVTSKFKCGYFVMISSLEAGNGKHYITESLRITELALEHFFKDTSTRLVIGRICDIVENRGSIVSMIESQIREKGPLELPSSEGQTYMISSYSAAQFVLQTIVEATKMDTGDVVFVCDAGAPVPLAEVATKIAKYYDLEFRAKPSFRPIPAENIPVYPSEVGSSRLKATFHKNVKVLKEDENLHSKNIQVTLKDFVLGNNSELSAEDWKKKTKLLLDLCGPRIFGSH
jgi:FlaA1/EpsC-like NDP-sugar epimerase/lipopolysaccharide/colanic/teichoic acid biosynthesis glycosyltransferase